MAHRRDRYAGAEGAIESDVVSGGAADGIFAVRAADFDAADAGGDRVALRHQTARGIYHHKGPGLDGLNGVVVDAYVADFVDRMDADVTCSANCAAAAAVVGERIAADIHIGVEILKPHARRLCLHAIVLDVAAGLGRFGGLSGHVRDVNTDVIAG